MKEALPPWPEAAAASRDRNQRPIQVTLDGAEVSMRCVVANARDGWVGLVRTDERNKPVWHGDHFATSVHHGKVVIYS